MLRIAAILGLGLFLWLSGVAGIFSAQTSNQNISALPLPICAVQGSGLSSPFVGRTVRVSGVVTADFDTGSPKGFFVQSENCDGDPSTSDGIFIFLGERAEVVSVGDRVRVTGLVDEYFGMTEIQASPSGVVVLSSSNPLPSAQELNPPFQNQAARMHFEALEAMRVRLDDGRVVGPTDADDRSWLVRADLGVERIMYADPRVTGEVICADDRGRYAIAPEVKTGDRVSGLEGVLDFRLGIYCVQLTSKPAVQVSPAGYGEGARTPASAAINLATFNLQNLFDTVDDSQTADQVLTPAEYQRRLQKRALAIAQDLEFPAILGVQEVENREVLETLISQPEFTVNYAIVHDESPDPRGLDLALLYRPDQATLLQAAPYQGCSGLVDGFGPDGNDDPHNPQNLLTCDRNGDGALDGSRLFSRPPLAAHFLGRPSAAAGLERAPGALDVYEFWVIVCHFKSKVGDSSTVEYTLPRRIEQAQFVASLAGQMRSDYPNAQIVVLGDFNDHPGSPPRLSLAAAGLQSALQLAPPAEQYSYIYRGVSQATDDILFVPKIGLTPVNPRALHINADYPAALMSVNVVSQRSSDHDPVIVGFAPATPSAFLPRIGR